MPRKYRNFNNVGKVSGLLLLLLAFLAVNPVMTKVYAEESAEASTEENYFETSLKGSDEGNKDSDVASLLADTPSTVNISFAPAFGSASLSPTTSAGKSAQINVLATVSVQNSGGYSVYLKGNSVNLVGQNDSANFIPGTPTPKTYAEMDVNTWGYYAQAGTSIPDTATYKAIVISDNGEKIAENTDKAILSESKDIMLSFAAKVNDTKPADTYKNTITMSVISSPIQVAVDFGIGAMQEMTSTICSNARDNDGNGEITGQLRDTRDGKYYWVSKLVDGKCWMTQNLDLDLDASITPLTPATSDVSANWTPGDAGKNPAYTETAASSATIYADNTGQRSWSLGNYRIISPTASSNCGSGKASVADCPSQFTSYTTPTTANGDTNAHYILGNHYQWNAATAGTGGTNTSSNFAQAPSSICPKNWRLPTSTSSGELQALITAGSIDTVAKLASSPYYFVQGGDVDQGTSSLFINAGDYGYYWSSTPDFISKSAYSFFFYGTSNIYPSGEENRRVGFSVRCVAK